jgi:biopolymer transport protein ExbB
MPADILLGYMHKGGFFMYPILLCSIVSLAIFFEKLRVLQRKRVIPPGFLIDFEHMLRAEKIAPALELCKQIDVPIHG